jgi:outer membrane autotransporter protein
MNTPSSKKFLAAAVLCSLLGTTPVWAATQTATDRVTTSNTAGTRYTSINVTQESATEKYEIIGISNPGTGDMTVYMAPGATISASSAADGTRIGQNAYGITNIITSLTVDEALKVTVTAATAATPKGADMDVSATGVGSYKADLTLGLDGAANTITVKADAGTYTGVEAGSSLATAAGIESQGGAITISGDTTLNASAQGMTPGAGSNVNVGRAEAEANGIVCSCIPIPIGSTSHALKLGGLTGTISAQGGTVNTGSDSAASARAYGIENYETTLTADSVNLTAQATGGTAGGQASTADVAARAEGIIQNGSTKYGPAAQLTVTGPTSVKVSATGGGYEGTGSAESSNALAFGIGAMAVAPYTSGIPYSGTYKLSDVTAVVRATGGTDNAGSTDPDNPTTGADVSAVAAGVITGIGSLTAKNLDLTVSAQGGTAAGKDATINVDAEGLTQKVSPAFASESGSVRVTGATRLNVTATGGNTTGTGSRIATTASATNAIGIKNVISENQYTSSSPYNPAAATMELGTVEGSVTATGGTVNTDGVSTENFAIITTALGVMNGVQAEGFGNIEGGSLSLDSLKLNVAATGAKLTGSTESSLTQVCGIAQNSNDSEEYGHTTLTISGATNLDVMATGAEPVGSGILTQDDTSANGFTYTTISGDVNYEGANLGPFTATVTAVGGTVNDTESVIETGAAGIMYDNQVTAQDLDLTVSATGGTVKGTTDGKANTAASTVMAYAIMNDTGSTSSLFQLTVPGDVNFKVTATGSKAAEGAAVKTSTVKAYGINLSGAEGGTDEATLGSVTGTVTLNNGAATDPDSDEGGSIAAGILVQTFADLTSTGDVDLTVTANGTEGNNSADALSAVGMAATENSHIQVNGNATIKAAVNPVAGTDGYDLFAALALEAAAAGSTINLGTDGAGNSLNTTVQLEGGVLAVQGGTVNLTLDNSASYLQGNVYATSFEGRTIQPGTVNLVVANGATWRPVYDNRNGDFNNGKVNHAPDYTVTENSIDTLTLKDGGIVDLTWDNPTRSSEFRTLEVKDLTGDGGVFKINADLANNKADSISVGEGSASTQAYIDVAYDPYFANETLSAGKSVTGTARVVTASPTTMTFAGKQDSYNLYTYTPTLVNNGDGTWDLTALTIDSAKTSGHVKTAGVDRLGLNSLFLFETNSLSRRLGELRDAATNENASGKNSGAAANASGKTAGATSDSDKTSSIWARYYDGKLEQGDASLKAHLFQAGYDKSSIGASEKTYRGAALSYAKGDGTYALGSGDMKETTFSLYQTGIKNDGRYYDVVLKAGKYTDDYDVTATANPSSADYDTWAYSISGEMGKRIDLGKGLYVEPQAELILGRLNGADYTTSTGMQVSVDAQNKAITRLGLAFGKSYTRGSLYGKFSYYHDFGTGVDLNAADGGNSVGYSEDLARNWTELTIGGSAKLGKSCNAYAEVSKYMGQLSSNIRYNIGARWSF